MPLKRNVPPPVKSILDIDSKLTSVICNSVSRFLPVRSFTTYYKGLEVKFLQYIIKKLYLNLIKMFNINIVKFKYSCHGIVWIACWLTFIWFAWSKSLFQMQVNLLIGKLIQNYKLGFNS